MTSYLWSWEVVVLKLAKESWRSVPGTLSRVEACLGRWGGVDGRVASVKRSRVWLQKWINLQVLSQLDQELVYSQAQRCFRQRECSEGDVILCKPRAREALR